MMNATATKDWAKTAKEVDDLCDTFGTPLDPGIKNTVIALRLLGYKTIGSCQGHLDHGTGGPWVNIMIDEAEELEQSLKHGHHALPTLEAIRINRQVKLVADKHLLELRRLLREFYRDRKVRLDTKLTIHNPGGGLVIIESRGVSKLLWKDLLEPRYSAKNLKAYQTEMRAFTKFLRNQL